MRLSLPEYLYDERRAQDEVQKITDRFIAEVDKALVVKEADLMEI